jgi:hypothetical protein
MPSPYNPSVFGVGAAGMGWRAPRARRQWRRWPGCRGLARSEPSLLEFRGYVQAANESGAP